MKTLTRLILFLALATNAPAITTSNLESLVTDAVDVNVYSSLNVITGKNATATIIITNAPEALTNAAIRINGLVFTWTTTSVASVLQMQATNSIPQATTNMFNAIIASGLTNSPLKNLFARTTSTNTITIGLTNSLELAVSNGANFATSAVSTNLGGSTSVIVANILTGLVQGANITIVRSSNLATITASTGGGGVTNIGFILGAGPGPGDGQFNWQSNTLFSAIFANGLTISNQPLTVNSDTFAGYATIQSNTVPYPGGSTFVRTNQQANNSAITDDIFWGWTPDGQTNIFGFGAHKANGAGTFATWFGFDPQSQRIIFSDATSANVLSPSVNWFYLDPVGKSIVFNNGTVSGNINGNFVAGGGTVGVASNSIERVLTNGQAFTKMPTSSVVLLDPSSGIYYAFDHPTNSTETIRTTSLNKTNCIVFINPGLYSFQTQIRTTGTTFSARGGDVTFNIDALPTGTILFDAKSITFNGIKFQQTVGTAGTASAIWMDLGPYIVNSCVFTGANANIQLNATGPTVFRNCDFFNNGTFFKTSAGSGEMKFYDCNLTILTNAFGNTGADGSSKVIGVGPVIKGNLWSGGSITVNGGGSTNAVAAFETSSGFTTLESTTIVATNGAFAALAGGGKLFISGTSIRPDAISNNVPAAAFWRDAELGIQLVNSSTGTVTKVTTNTANFNQFTGNVDMPSNTAAIASFSAVSSVVTANTFQANAGYFDNGTRITNTVDTTSFTFGVGATNIVIPQVTSTNVWLTAGNTTAQYTNSSKASWITVKIYTKGINSAGVQADLYTYPIGAFDANYPTQSDHVENWTGLAGENDIVFTLKQWANPNDGFIIVTNGVNGNATPAGQVLASNLVVRPVK